MYSGQGTIKTKRNGENVEVWLFFPLEKGMERAKHRAKVMNEIKNKND